MGQFSPGRCARDIPVTDAVAEVKRALAAEGRPAQEWAGFVLVGNPMVRVGGGRGVEEEQGIGNGEWGLGSAHHPEHEAFDSRFPIP